MTTTHFNLRLEIPSNHETYLHWQTEKIGGGSFAVLKQGWAKVKEEGGMFRGLVWNDRFLVLREYTLDFMKSNESGKVQNTIYLKDVTNIARSEVHPGMLLS